MPIQICFFFVEKIIRWEKNKGSIRKWIPDDSAASRGSRGSQGLEEGSCGAVPVRSSEIRVTLAASSQWEGSFLIDLLVYLRRYIILARCVEQGWRTLHVPRQLNSFNLIELRARWVCYRSFVCQNGGRWSRWHRRRWFTICRGAFVRSCHPPLGSFA